jgi:hypothetical protein
MIRIEGIPVVAARLAAAAEFTKVRETAPVRSARMRQRLAAKPFTTALSRRLQAHEQACA